MCSSNFELGQGLDQIQSYFSFGCVGGGGGLGRVPLKFVN